MDTHTYLGELAQISCFLLLLSLSFFFSHVCILLHMELATTSCRHWSIDTTTGGDLSRQKAGKNFFGPADWLTDSLRCFCSLAAFTVEYESSLKHVSGSTTGSAKTIQKVHIYRATDACRLPPVIDHGKCGTKFLPERQTCKLLFSSGGSY